MAADLCFIVCAPRSGSTMLSRMFNAHPDVAAPFEIGIPSIFLNSGKESAVLAKTVKICELIGIEPRKTLHDPQYFLEGIRAFENKTCVLCKDPRHAVYLPRIRCEFGDVPLIHLIRDVRHVCQSGFMRERPMKAMRQWYIHHTQILKYGPLFSNVLRVKYEDILTSPREELTRLCDGLGVEFDEQMLKFWEVTHHDDDLELWDGKTAADVGFHDNLFEGRLITERVEADVPERVERLLDKAPPIRALNEDFGYGTGRG